MKELIIQSGETGKGRSFRAALLACVTSRSLWAAGQSENTRPIWAMLGCSEAESVPFIRNLQSGNKAAILGERTSSRRGSSETFECLKSADYSYVPQRLSEGTVWTVYLPALFRVDPGMTDPEWVRFCLLPKPEWLAPVDPHIAAALAELYRSGEHKEAWAAKYAAEEHAKRLRVAEFITRIAQVFQARLDRHTRCPLIPDARFAALVLAAMLDERYATLTAAGSYMRTEWGHSTGDYCEEGLDDVGLAPGISCCVKHERLEPLLAKCVVAYEQGAGR